MRVPPGPALEITPEIEKAYFAFKEGDQPKSRIRSRFDPLSVENVELEPTYPLQVAGQAFFITNGEPMYFWDFARAVWNEMGHDVPTRTWNIPTGLGFVLGSLSEWFSTLLGKEPGLTRGRIYYVTAHRWFNIEKSRRVLGYEPDVGIEEGIKRAVAVRPFRFDGVTTVIAHLCSLSIIVVERRGGEKREEGIGTCLYTRHLFFAFVLLADCRYTLSHAFF